MKNFTVYLSAVAMLACSAEAIRSPNMYDPMNFAQTLSSADPAPAKKDAPAPAADAKSTGKDAINKKTDVKKETKSTDAGFDQAIKKKWCVENVSATFTAADATPLQKFTTFVNDICPQLEAEVPMGVVVSQCFHTGYFMLRELSPLADAMKGPNGVEYKTNLVNYVEDFCDTYDKVLPKRTGFVRAINGIEDPIEFQDECFKQLADDGSLNTWFDPIDPLSSITQKEICDLHFKLFKSLRKKQRTSLAEYVSFSYIASLDLFLNAHMQEDLENCVNTHVVKHPHQWVSSFVQEHPAFKNWEHKQKTEAEAAVPLHVESACANKQACAAAGSCEQCDACSVAISRVYFNYQTYLNNLFAATFKTYSESMFDRLHQANLVLEGKDTPQAN